MVRARMRRGSRWRRAAIGGLAAAVLAGCSDRAGSAGATPSAGSTITVTEGTRTATRSVTITSTSAAPVAQPPGPTDEPAPVAAACPYLSDDEVADINGQRTGQTTVVDVSPQPICTFTRSDGGWLATVRIVQADSAEAAAAAVDQHVPVEESSPADDPAGWAGGSMPTADGSVYAVSKGTVAVIAEANQPQSIKGRQMAVTAIEHLGL